MTKNAPDTVAKYDLLTIRSNGTANLIWTFAILRSFFLPEPPPAFSNAAIWFSSYSPLASPFQSLVWVLLPWVLPSSVLLLYTPFHIQGFSYYLCAQICSYTSEYSPKSQIYLTGHLHLNVPLNSVMYKTEHINFTAKPEPPPILPYLGKKEYHPRKIFLNL